jgi:hypothetical protein
MRSPSASSTLGARARAPAASPRRACRQPCPRAGPGVQVIERAHEQPNLYRARLIGGHELNPAELTACRFRRSRRARPSGTGTLRSGGVPLFTYSFRALSLAKKASRWSSMRTLWPWRLSSSRASVSRSCWRSGAYIAAGPHQPDVPVDVEGQGHPLQGVDGRVTVPILDVVPLARPMPAAFAQVSPLIRRFFRRSWIKAVGAIRDGGLRGRTC